MKFFLKHARTGLPDVMATMTVLVIVIAALRFLVDGATLALFGHSISFGHSDPSSYAAFLSPVLGSHAFLNSRGNTVNPLAPGQDNDNKS